MTNYFTTSHFTNCGESSTAGPGPVIEKTVENHSRHLTSPSHQWGKATSCLSSQFMKHLSLLLLLLVMGVGSVWGEDTANVADGGNITATTTLSNDNKTCTWTNVSATAKVDKGTSSYGKGLGIVASSSNGVDAGSITTLSKVATLYVKVPSATSTDTISVYKAGSDGNERTLTLKGGNTMTQKKTDAQNVSFSSNDIVNVNGGYYIQLSNSSTDFKYSEIVVTLTKDGETYSVSSTYTVTFDNASDKGNCTTSSLTQESEGASITLPNVTPKADNTFLGWSTNSGATVADAGLYSGASYTPSGNVTLYAVYRSNSATIGDANSGWWQNFSAFNELATDKNRNYTFTVAGGDASWKNWVLIATNNNTGHNGDGSQADGSNEIFCLRADGHMWGTTSKSQIYKLNGSTYEAVTAVDNSDFITAMSNGTVKLSVSRVGKRVYVYATSECTNGAKYVQTFTSGEITSNVYLSFTAQNSSITFTEQGNADAYFVKLSGVTNGTADVLSAEGISIDQTAVKSGTQVSFTATPNEGYSFNNWTGTVTSTDNPFNTTVTSALELTPNFQQANSITITAHPQNASYTQFATPTALSVTATAGTGTCTYQWQSSSSENGTYSNISNATSATYTPATTTVGTMYYRCVVSATDCDDVISNVATITVTGGSSTVESLTQITPPYTYTPSAALPLKTLAEDGKIISPTGGCDYKSGYGLNFKDNRYIAFKVPANATIIVEAGNHGTNGARTIQLGSSTSSLTNLSTLEVAQGTTGTLTYKYEAGGIVYLSASADLYLKKLTVTTGYTLHIHLNGHASDDETFENQTNIENPMRVPEADGYTFVGWYTDQNLTQAAVAGATLTEETHIYAKWTINKGYTIPFDGNGITVTEDHLVEPQRGMGVMLPTAYETVTNIDIPANEEANWTFASSVSGKGLYKETIREAFFNISVPAGNVLTQQVTGLAAGKYEVVLDVAASATNLRDFKTEGAALPTGNNLTQAFASSGSNDAAKYIPVLDRTVVGTYSEEYDRIALVVEVAESGTLTYGIKNTAASGNWYLCRVHSIKKVDDTNFTGWNTKADGTGTSYTAGTNLSPDYNGTILYAQWNKTYTFRPVASNGNLVSVTVNGTPIDGVVNNHDYTVPEKATIVMTVTPSSGYKFKNWVLTSGGTAGAESTNGNNYIYTISSITANTTVTAKFEALGTATDPNPANGTLDGTAVTINAFPASYAGNVQQVNLGLPTGATAVVKTDGTGLNASITDGVLSIKAPTAPTGETANTATITITVTAENGSTKDYTVTVSTVKGAEYNYTVNAVDGSGNVLQTIKTGVYAEGTGVVYMNYPEYIKVGTEIRHIKKEYSATNITSAGWYQVSFTPNAANYTVNLPYTEGTVKDIVNYSEGEDALNMRVNHLTRASNGAMGRNSAEQIVANLPTGTYYIKVKAINGNNDAKTYYVKAGDNTILTGSVASGSTNDEEYATFSVTGDTDIKIDATAFGNGGGLDWFYIQDYKTLPVTVDGQKLGLTKEIIDNTSYTTQSNSGTSSQATKGDFTGHFYDIKNSDKYITVTEKGATSFEVFAYHGNGTETRTLNIFDGDGTTPIGSVSIEPGKTCSSGIIAIDSKSSTKTITLKGAGSDVFPAYIVFYTRPMLNVLTSTIKMGKGKQDITLSTTTGTGTIAMTTPSSAASAIVTASFSDNTLSLTPVKAGTTKLAFTITDDAVEYPVEYTVNVVKQVPTITYRANNKVTYNATAASATDFASPTAVVKDEDGNDVTNSVSLIYISDDETLVTFNGSNASLIPNIQGSAKLKCVLYNNDTYENAMATFTVNISAGIDKKLYTLVDGDKVGEDVPAINTTLVAKDENDNTLMTMIYGGYKYGTYTHFGDKGKINDTWKGDSGKDTKFNEYNGQGTDIYGNRFDNEIDDFGFQTQAQYDSRDEYNKGIEWFKTTDVKTDGTTHYTEYERIKPFSLPCKGAYLKFEAEVNGTLTAYVLQNGNITFSSEEGMRDKPKAGDALGGNPRIYYWFNQDGYRIAPTSFTSKQPLTIGRDYNADVVNELQEWCNRPEYSGLNEYLQTDAGWPTQAQVDANLQKPVPDPQPVVRFHEGYMVAQKAYVKYVIPVVAGETYYFFSNASKVGVAGYNFLPDENGTVNLILPEGGTLNANTNETVKALNTTTDIATTHKTTGSIEMYKTVTLPRQFKQNTWSTICLPFHVTEAQVERVFGKGTNLIIYNGIETIDGKPTARFQKHVNQDILAGQPYLIYPTGTDVTGITNEYIGGDGTNITGLTFTNVNFTPNVAVQSYASDKDDEKGDDGYGTGDISYQFIGTLGQTRVNKYDYYINNKTGKLTRYTGNGTTLNAYYGYLKNAAETPSSAKTISGIAFDDFESVDEDITTGLLETVIDMGMVVAPTDGVYNLSGQKVANSTENLPKGIYIINGKKVNIK